MQNSSSVAQSITHTYDNPSQEVRTTAAPTPNTATAILILPPLVFDDPPDKLLQHNSHPRDHRIQFFDIGHIYDVDGRRDFVSCTTMMHRFYEPFDADAVVAKMQARDIGFREGISPAYVMRSGKYAGLTAEQIKTLWTNKGTQASYDGTLMHACIEYYYNDGLDQFPYPQPLEFTDQFAVFHREVVEARGLIPYRTEWCVFHEAYELAGSIDMLYQVDADDPDRLVIYDWKRSCKLSEQTNRYRQMLPPLDHLPDTAYWHYAMQLNIYRHILETKYGKTIEGMYLVGIHPELLPRPYQEEKVPILRVETEGILERRMEELERASASAAASEGGSNEDGEVAGLM